VAVSACALRSSVVYLPVTLCANVSVNVPVIMFTVSLSDLVIVSLTLTTLPVSDSVVRGQSLFHFDCETEWLFSKVKLNCEELL